ncbi:MAG: DegT/DnrJ/EryC1/StrS aminotransferase family protein [Candidatus Solibacter sp.]
MTRPIPFHVPSIGEEEINEVVAVLRSGWLTTGPRTATFEAEFREYLGCRSALAVNSATAGLHLALAASGIGPGDEVITTPMTFCATVNVILHVGAEPVLADVLPDGNIDPASVAARISSRTKAIIPVHLAGKPCDMDALWALARRHGLKVIEDAAHATEAHYHGLPLGSAAAPHQSDAVAFSFYATKNITTGEGGMVVTNDMALAERMRCLCLHGISKDAWNRYGRKGKWQYQVLENGFKYNLSDIQSGIGIHQLRKIEKLARKRRRLVTAYNAEFAGVDEIETPPPSADGRHAWHLYAIRLNLEALTIDRDEFMEKLQQCGIGASVHFIPIPLHPYFKKYAGLPRNQCPKAMDLYLRSISLPLYPDLTLRQVKRVATTVKNIVAANRAARNVAAASA